MDYPVWLLTGLNSGLIIAGIAVLHVFVAQFAVGGGLYLVGMEQLAARRQCPALLGWLERHTRFFLLLTMVFGGISGVGIWFAMCVVNPAGTALLVHNFVFFWAAEWTLFLLEVLALLAYDWTWPARRKGTLDPAAHRRAGLVYAGAAFASLVLINGILTFMLTPGAGPTTGNVWQGFFNPTYLPALLTRTAICLMLAGMFGLFSAPRIASAAARRLAVRWSALWVVLPVAPLLGGSVWYFAALPPVRQQAILRRGADVRPFLETYGWLIPVLLLAGVLAFVRAERLRRPAALVILCAGLALVGSFEWIREAGRRPWLVEGVQYANGISVAQAARAQAQGAGAVSGWLRSLEQGPGVPVAANLSRGALLFAAQCGVCHGLNGPRLDVVPRVRGLTARGLEALLSGLGTRLAAMPPFAGNAADRAALARYLKGVAGTHALSTGGGP